MQTTITITDSSKLIALQRALEAFNATAGAPLTANQFIQLIVDSQVNVFAQRHLLAQITKLDFLNRFTTDERIGIREAAKVSPAIHDYMAMLDAAQDVDLTDARTIGGVQALEAAGLIGEGRAAVILAL